MLLNCGQSHNVSIVKQRARGRKGRKAKPYNTLHGVADTLKAPIRALVVRAIVDTKNEVSASALAGLIRQGNSGEVLNAIPFGNLEEKLDGLGGVLSLATTRGAEASIKNLRAPLTIGINFNVDDPRIISFIARRTGELSQVLSDESKRAITTILLRSIDQGIPPLRSANFIKDVIGLTEKQAVAVDNFRQKLIADGVPVDQAFSRASERAEAFIERRAETIARTETMRGANFGQLELGEQIQEQTGLVIRKRWIVTPDDRLCPICEPLDNVLKDMGQNFVSFGNSVETPPIHPNCRCAFEFIPV